MYRSVDGAKQWDTRENGQVPKSQQVPFGHFMLCGQFHKHFIHVTYGPSKISISH
jgi:hypothetical protein